MSPSTEYYLKSCLFFTANSLARTIAKMAEEEFGKLGLSSSHAFLVMLVVESPGVSQKSLGETLNLAPSTVSRFVDNLVKRGLIKKSVQGKTVAVSPTEMGTGLLPGIQAAWKSVYERYSVILGEEAAENLTQATYEAQMRLAEKE